MKKKIIIRTSLFLFTILTVGVVTILIHKIIATYKKDAPTDPPTDPPTDAPTDPPTDPPTDAPTDPPTDTPIPDLMKNTDTIVKSISIVLFTIEILLILWLFSLVTSLFHISRIPTSKISDKGASVCNYQIRGKKSAKTNESTPNCNHHIIFDRNKGKELRKKIIIGACIIVVCFMGNLLTMLLSESYNEPTSVTFLLNVIAIFFIFYTFFLFAFSYNVGGRMNKYQD